MDYKVVKQAFNLYSMSDIFLFASKQLSPHPGPLSLMNLFFLFHFSFFSYPNPNPTLMNLPPPDIIFFKICILIDYLFSHENLRSAEKGIGFYCQSS